MKKLDLSLYLVTDQRIPWQKCLESVRRAITGGVSIVQLREKNKPKEEIAKKAKELLSVLKPLRIPLILNDHVDLARDVGAQGVHIGQNDCRVEKARKILGPDAILGLSIENFEQLEKCNLRVCDYLSVSPVFPTTTKEDAATPLGIEGLLKIRKACRLPLVAIGGIDATHAGLLASTGIDGICVVSSIFQSQEPEKSARALREAFRGTARILTIAGSDSGGGAGIQADLKTFEALACYGMSAITALTAQNTQTVRSIHPVPPPFIEEQLSTVFDDIEVSAVKIGMLHSAEVIETVARFLKSHCKAPIVLDPVMVAKGGSALLKADAIEALRELLVPMVTVLTPNLPESELLLHRKISEKADMEAAANAFLNHVPHVVLKGGHLENESWSPDYFSSREFDSEWIEYPRIPTKNTHGTGCTYSAAIAAFLGKGKSPRESVLSARDYLQGALLSGARRNIGKGKGPVHHAY